MVRSRNHDAPPKDPCDLLSHSAGRRSARRELESGSIRRAAGLSRARRAQEAQIAKILLLYYSSYGHVEALAGAIAEGARTAGAVVDVRRVPEAVPEEIARSANFKLDPSASIATIAELEGYDAIVVGTETRLGRLSSQMAAFVDQAGGL